MHEKCIILRFEIVVFSVMGSCNVNGQHTWFGLHLLLPSSDGLSRQNMNAPSNTFINIYVLPAFWYYQTIRCPNSTTLQILTTVSTSTPVPNIIKNWNVDGKSHLENWIIQLQYILSHTFPTNCEHCYILRLNTVIYCAWTLLYIMSEHCYILCLQ